MRTDIEYVRGLESRLRELRTAADLADAEYRDEIARMRLTDSEREAVRYMIAAAKFGQRDEALTEERAATLRKLLARLSPPAT